MEEVWTMTKHNDDLKAAIDAMDLDKARRIFRDAQAEADAETYYLAAKIALDDEQKQEFLQKALELDPFHEKARAALKGDSQAAATSAPATTPSPAPTSVGAASPEDFVSATVKAPKGQTNLMLIPFEQGEVRTVVKDAATVYIVARYTDPYKRTWYNVVYQSTVSTAHGWLPGETLGDLHVRGQEIEPMDIPVTEFQFNKKDDFAQRLQHIQLIEIWGIGTPMAFAFVCHILFYSFEDFLMAVSCLGSVVGMLIAIGVAVRFYPGKGKEGAELIRIRKSLRSDYEVMRDDQRENMMMGAALQLGTNVITRRVADRKEITFK